MSETNRKTLASYEEHITDYIKDTPQKVEGDVKKWIDRSLSNLPSNARILELGSAFGRDADYIESCGYKVVRSDATRGFIEYMKQQGHEDVRELNILSDEIQKSYDMVIADAVLLHFNRDEMFLVLGKVFNALRDDGLFAFTLKKGEGDEWSTAKLDSPRYFCYWGEDQIKVLLAKVGFRDVQCETKSLRGRTREWLHIIAKK